MKEHSSRIKKKFVLKKTSKIDKSIIRAIKGEIITNKIVRNC